MSVDLSSLLLTLDHDGPDADGNVDVRLTVFNPTSEVITFDRPRLYGPHPGRGELVMLATEPSASDPAHEQVVLNPSCFHGRQRRYQYPDGDMSFHGFLVTEPTDGLLPTGPTDSSRVAAIAEPVVVSFGPR